MNNDAGWLESLDAETGFIRRSIPWERKPADFLQSPICSPCPNSEIRGCIVADDGSGVIDPDLANIEMRIAAWFAQEQQILDIFRNGGDIHGQTAARILGDRQARQSAKPVNLGSLTVGVPTASHYRANLWN